MNQHADQSAIQCPDCRGTGKVISPDARCGCGHRYDEHHYNGPHGGCCVEVDRYELCRCKRLRLSRAKAGAAR